MNKLYRMCVTLAPVFVFIFAMSISAQWDKKPYTEWSEKEAMKVLNDSPWGQTQVFSDTSNEFGTGPGGRAGGGRSSGDYSTHHLNIRIRFLSAKPIRQAFGRMMLLEHKGSIPDELAARMSAFASQDLPDYIIVCVDADANETKNELHQFKALLSKLTMVDLQNRTYLLANGQRTYIQSFQRPNEDGLGAKFIFPRNVNGKPVIAPDSKEIQFFGGFASRFALNMRFKVKDMMVDGKLEY